MSVSVSAPNAAAGGEGGYSYSIEVVNKHEVQNRISRGKPCPAQHLFNPPTCLRWRLAVRKVRKEGGTRHGGDRGVLVFVSMLTWVVERVEK